MRFESADRYGRVAAAEHRFPGEAKPMSLTLLVPLLVTFGLESVPLSPVAITVGEPFPLHKETTPIGMLLLNDSD